MARNEGKKKQLQLPDFYILGFDCVAINIESGFKIL
jgi:hypothetical protein